MNESGKQQPRVPNVSIGPKGKLIITATGEEVVLTEEAWLLLSSEEDYYRSANEDCITVQYTSGRYGGKDD